MSYIHPGCEYWISCTHIELHGHGAQTGSCLLFVGSVLSSFVLAGVIVQLTFLNSDHAF